MCRSTQVESLDARMPSRTARPRICRSGEGLALTDESPSGSTTTPVARAEVPELLSLVSGLTGLRSTLEAGSSAPAPPARRRSFPDGALGRCRWRHQVAYGLTYQGDCLPVIGVAPSEAARAHDGKPDPVACQPVDAGHTPSPGALQLV